MLGFAPFFWMADGNSAIAHFRWIYLQLLRPLQKVLPFFLSFSSFISFRRRSRQRKLWLEKSLTRGAIFVSTRDFAYFLASESSSFSDKLHFIRGHFFICLFVCLLRFRASASPPRVTWFVSIPLITPEALFLFLQNWFSCRAWLNLNMYWDWQFKEDSSRGTGLKVHLWI